MRQLIAIFAILGCIVSAQGAYAIQVTVNGSAVVFDQSPVMTNGHVLVPLRGVFERLGATVQYNGATRGITASTGATQISLQIGNRMASVNGQNRQLESAPIEIGGRAMVPLRFVSEALGADVHWDESQQLVVITSSNAQANYNNGNNNYNNTTYENPPAYNPPYQSAPVITSVMSRETGPLSAGQALHAIMYGTSGGRATFDLGNGAGIPMYEGPSGTYRGTYTVSQQDNVPNALITAHLSMPDGRQVSMSAQQTVFLQGNNYNNNNGNNQGFYGQLINSVIHDGHGSLRFGQTLTVTMSAASGCSGSFDVGSHTGIPMTETSQGTYTGSFTLALGDIQPNATVTAHLRTPNNQTASLVAAPTVSLLGFP